MPLVSSQRTLVAGALLGLILMAAGAPAFGDSQKENLQVVSIAPVLIVGDPSVSPSETIVSYSVSGPNAGHLSVSLGDAVISPAGNRVDVPLGSTPDSLQGFVNIVDGEHDYVPNGEVQEFTSYIVAADETLSSTKFGHIVVALVPQADVAIGAGTRSATTSSLSISSNFLVTPFAHAGSATSRVSQSVIISQSISPAASSDLLDKIIPDIPGVFTHGRVSVVTAIQNTGVTPNLSTISWSFLVDGTSVETKTTPSKMLLAGEKLLGTDVSELALADKKGFVDALPDFGFVTLHTVVASTLGNTTYVPEERDTTILIFAWKGWFLGAVGLALLVWLLLRVRRAPSHNRKQHHSGGTPNDT